MVVRYALSVLLAALSACGEGPAGRATVSGTVTVGPLAGPCIAGTPCWKPARDVEILFEKDGEAVRTKSDEAGAFSLEIEPGTYRVRIPIFHEPPARIVQSTVTITGDRQLEIQVDSGRKSPARPP